jgi:hypothetical protein
MTEPNQQERRKYKRQNLIFFIPVVETSSQETIGHMADISSGGFKLTSQYKIPLEKDYHLGLITTPDIAGTEFVGFVARSKWCQTNEPDSDHYQYYVGFDIINIDPHDAVIYECILDKYGARDLYIM